MDKYTCTNYGGCSYADKRTAFIPTKSLTCPECGRGDRLKKVGGGANPSGGSFGKLGIVLAISALVTVGGGLYWWLHGNTIHPVSTTQPPAQTAGSMPPAPDIAAAAVVGSTSTPGAGSAGAPPTPPTGTAPTQPIAGASASAASTGSAIPITQNFPAPPATLDFNPTFFGVIEIGGKGIRGFSVDLADSSPDKHCFKTEERFADCFLNNIHTLDDQNVTPSNEDKIDLTAQTIKNMMDTLVKYHHVDPDHVYIVGSGSINGLAHKSKLKQAVEMQLGNQKAMGFVDENSEGAYGLQGVVGGKIPSTQRLNSILLDIGSDTKGGYLEETHANLTVTSFGMKWGWKSYSRYVNDKRGQDSFVYASNMLRSTVLQPEIRKMKDGNPGLQNRSHIYLIGGISWVLKTFTHSGTRQSLTKLTSNDIGSLYKRAIAPNALQTLCHDEKLIKQEPYIDDICGKNNIFTIDDIIAGLDLLKTLSVELGFNDKHKQIFFIDNAKYAWPLVYLKVQCETEKKC